MILESFQKRIKLRASKINLLDRNRARRDVRFLFIAGDGESRLPRSREAVLNHLSRPTLSCLPRCGL